MAEYAFWVLVSFFAVIGIMESMIGVMELLSLRKIRSVKSVALQISLSGEEPRAEYLLNTLSLMAERFQIGRHETILVIHDDGLLEESRQKILAYCEKNPWVVFTEE